MKNADPLLMLLATGGDENIEAMLHSELELVRMLTWKGLLSADQTAQAVRLRQSTGLLLEHCLVKTGAIDFDSMVEVLAERRSQTRTVSLQGTGDGGYGSDDRPLAG